ncbi:hypothetical protein CBL_03931 [Carabus blaptoides fortunei]
MVSSLTSFPSHRTTPQSVVPAKTKNFGFELSRLERINNRVVMNADEARDTGYAETGSNMNECKISADHCALKREGEQARESWCERRREKFRTGRTESGNSLLSYCARTMSQVKDTRRGM